LLSALLADKISDARQEHVRQTAIDEVIWRVPGSVPFYGEIITAMSIRLYHLVITLILVRF
jgi:hypothetical protein